MSIVPLYEIIPLIVIDATRALYIPPTHHYISHQHLRPGERKWRSCAHVAEPEREASRAPKSSQASSWDCEWFIGGI